MGLFACQVGHGQDFKQAILDMRSVLEGAKQLHIVMDVSVYERSVSNTVLYHDKVEINRDGNRYLYHYSNSDFLQNERYMIMVNKSEREMTVSRVDDQDEGDRGPKMNFDVDSILSLYQNPQHLGRDKGVDHFRVRQERTDVTQIDLYVNSMTHLLEKMEYLYDNGQRVLIRFTVFDVHPVFGENEFDEGRYVQVKNGKVSSAQAYQGYKVSTY
jgi:hypothetical protein